MFPSNFSAGKYGDEKSDYARYHVNNLRTTFRTGFVFSYNIVPFLTDAYERIENKVLTAYRHRITNYFLSLQ